MKNKVHPTSYQCKVSCQCGHTWETTSTAKEIRVEICSNCHPFYTGVQKIIDTGGRLERFKQRYAGSSGVYQFD